MGALPSWEERYALEPKGMRAGWVNILGKVPLMPRDVVFPIAGTKKKFQRTVASLRDYVKMVEQNAPGGEVWVGWSPTTQYELDGMDRVFGDIDSKDPEDALRRARRYEEWCMSEFEVQPPAIYTAGKGFHLHLTHDYVEGLGTAYSDAYATLVQGSGSSIDLHTLKYRKTYPRVPYCLNRKATGLHKRPMYSVPVDLTWSLKEIQQASAEIRITPFEVPHSTILADLLRPLVARNLRKQARFEGAPGDVQKAIHDDLVEAAIAFSESVGWKLVDSHGKPDGRRRVLSSLYIPALMRKTGGDTAIVLASVEQWVDQAGGDWKEYKRFTESTMKDCLLKDGTLRSPVGMRRFWFESQDLRVLQK